MIEPAAPAEGTQQIEASVTPPAQPEPRRRLRPSRPPTRRRRAPRHRPPPLRAMRRLAARERAGMAAPEAPAATPRPCRSGAVPVQEVAAPAPPPPSKRAQRLWLPQRLRQPRRYRALSGENVSSMIVMTEPIAADAVAPAAPRQPGHALRSAHPVPAPEQKPAVKPKPIATAAVKPAPKPATAPKPSPPAGRAARGDRRAG